MGFKLSDWVKWRLDSKRNTFVVITGEGQSGKTSLGMVLCMKTFKDFDLDCIAFPAERFLELIKNRPNSAILLEDAGVGWGSANWKSKVNRAISYAAQTCGLKHQLIVLTAPSIYMLDPNARRLMQIQIDMKDRGFGIISKVKENKRTKQLIFAPLKFKFNGHTTRIPSYRVGRPPEEMFLEFEERKNRYLDGFYSGLIQEVKVKDSDEMNEVYRDYEVIGSYRKVARKRGISESKAYRLIKQWEIENK